MTSNVDAGKFFKFFCEKTGYIVAQSRLGCKIVTPSRQLAQKSDWFNLSLSFDVGGPTLAKEVREAFAGSYPPSANSVCIEVLLKTSDGDTLDLENWHITFDSVAVHDSLPTSHIYHRLSILLRSVLIATRVTPAYRYYLDEQGDHAWKLLHNVRVGQPQLNLGPDAKSFPLGCVQCSLGTLKVSVSYRTRMCIDSKEPSTVPVQQTNKRIIHSIREDYFSDSNVGNNRLSSSPKSGSAVSEPRSIVKRYDGSTSPVLHTSPSTGSSPRSSPYMGSVPRARFSVGSVPEIPEMDILRLDSTSTAAPSGVVRRHVTDENLALAFPVRYPAALNIPSGSSPLGGDHHPGYYATAPPSLSRSRVTHSVSCFRTIGGYSATFDEPRKPLRTLSFNCTRNFNTPSNSTVIYNPNRNSGGINESGSSNDSSLGVASLPRRESLPPIVFASSPSNPNLTNFQNSGLPRKDSTSQLQFKMDSSENTRSTAMMPYDPYFRASSAITVQQRNQAKPNSFPGGSNVAQSATTVTLNMTELIDSHRRQHSLESLKPQNLLLSQQQQPQRMTIVPDDLPFARLLQTSFSSPSVNIVAQIENTGVFKATTSTGLENTLCEGVVIEEEGVKVNSSRHTNDSTSDSEDDYVKVSVVSPFLSRQTTLGYFMQECRTAPPVLESFRLSWPQCAISNNHERHGGMVVPQILSTSLERINEAIEHFAAEAIKFDSFVQSLDEDSPESKS